MTDVLDRLLTPASDSNDPVRRGPRRGRRRPDAPSPRRFRPDIEGMRAIAVISVVLYHANLGVRGGFVGVDVFFVISGYLITRQLLGSVGLSGIRSLPTFYSRRIKRLLPASATVVIAVVLAGRLWASPLQSRSIATDGIFTAFYGLNYRLAINGTQYLHQDDAVSPLQHFWSLGVEEQFYIFWPVLIILTGFVWKRVRTAVLALALTALIGLSYHWSIEITARSSSWAYFSLQTRAWELALGALVAVGAGWLAGMPKVLGELGALAGLAIVIASCFIVSDASRYPGSIAALPVFGSALVIACGAGGVRRVERFLGESMMQCFGRISYSWYLWHWPMLIMTPIIVGHALTWQQRVVLVWASIGVAIASYHFIEDPGRRIKLGTVPWLGFGAVLSAAVVCAGLVVVANPANLVGKGAAVTLATGDTATPAVDRQMNDAVAAGILVQAAPSNLTPSPQHAATDLPAADSTSCHAAFLVITQGACVYGDPNGSHTAVLMGDSHADMWLPAFNAAGIRQHWKIVDWTKSSCPAAKLTVFNSSLNRTYTECDTWRAQVIPRIAALKPDLVFVSGSENVVGSSVSPAQWSAATLATMNALRSSSGAKIELIQDVPVPAHNLPDCVAAHINSVTKCTFATAKAYSFPSRHRELATDARQAGFTVVDPQSWICTTKTCPAIVGNILVYRDDTHLTATFSAWLAPRVMPLLSVSKAGS
jgi:peptidoglycan/LPS O-acetylase OafA/YrhL